VIWDFLDDYFGWVCLALVALMVGGLVYAAGVEGDQKSAACAKMWTVARTSADTLLVIERCELPKEPDVVPVFIPIYGGGR
jgi:hypothetical protein